jgi:hypothetical protein
MVSEFKWIINHASFFLNRTMFQNGTKFLRSRPFTIDGQLWVAQYSPSDGDFGIYLLQGQACTCSFTVETKTSVKHSAMATFDIGKPFGCKNFIPKSELEMCIDTNDSFQLMVSIG